MKIKITTTLKESFKDVLAHKTEWVRVAFSPAGLWFLGLVFMISLHLWVGHPILPENSIGNQAIINASTLHRTSKMSEMRAN